MIKALIQKELRENLKVAALALLGFTLMAVWSFHSYGTMIARLVAGFGLMDPNSSQPLLSPVFLMQTAWLCGVFGAVLGWTQINHERNPDLWGYLVHRPATRTQIFLGKIAAGLALYLLAAGLPLAALAVWCAVPGHIAAPFEWPMAVPMLKLLIAGVACYFGGMVTSLRQARWYMSRGFGLGLALAAVFVSMTGYDMPPFWLWALAIVVFGGVLALAAWGGFLSHGQYEGQPLAGRLATSAAVIVGTAFVSVFAFEAALDLLRPVDNSPSSNSYRAYVMSKDGTIWIWRRHFDGTQNDFFGMDGKPVMSAKTGRPMEQAEFFSRQAPQGYVQVNFGDKRIPRYYQEAEDPFFVPVHSSRDVLWYFWRKSGRVVAYDLRSRLPVSSLGPDGYARDLRGNGDRFVDNDSFNSSSESPWRLLQTTNTVYQADLDQRTLKPVFTTSDDEPVGGSGSLVLTASVTPGKVITQGENTFYLGETVVARETNVIVATRHYIHVLSTDGREILKTAYQPSYPDFGQVRVSALEPDGRFAVWFDPTVPEKRRLQLGLRTHVTWLGADACPPGKSPGRGRGAGRRAGR